MWLSLFVTAAVAAAPKPPLIPTLSKPLVIDGDWKDFSPALERKAPADPNLSLTSRVAYRKGTLYLGARVVDKSVSDASEVKFTLFFADAGVTATGYSFHVGPQGLVQSKPEEGTLTTPAFALKLATAAAKKSGQGLDVELSVPARALPRFSAMGTLGLTVCTEYQHAANGPVLAACNPAEAALLPQEMRAGLGFKVPKDVVGLEGREGGWVGFAALHFVNFVWGDAPLTAASVGALVAPDDAVVPEKARLPIPTDLTTPDHKPLVIVLTGADPFDGDECHNEREVRMAWYVVNGRTAFNVLEWPASSCTLGKAMRFDLSEDGNLAIGYTQGNTTHFTWSGDHFERSELGKAVTTW